MFWVSKIFFQVDYRRQRRRRENEHQHVLDFDHSFEEQNRNKVAEKPIPDQAPITKT